MRTSNLDDVVRELTAGLDQLSAEGRRVESALSRWTELARQVRGAVASQADPIGPEARHTVPTVPPEVTEATGGTRGTEATEAPGIVCRSCGNRLKASAKFCSGCGTQVHPPAGPAPRFCTNCGNALRPQARFCPTCGTTVTGDTR
ncbi:MAG: zinc ribbon domain-containing protein [Vicinamibacterales bacterium]